MAQAHTCQTASCQEPKAQNYCMKTIRWGGHLLKAENQDEIIIYLFINT